VESLVSLSWCIRQGTRGEGDEDADYLPPGYHSVLRTWMRFDGLVVGLAIGIDVCRMWEDVGIIESVDGFCVQAYCWW